MDRLLILCDYSDLGLGRWRLSHLEASGLLLRSCLWAPVRCDRPFGMSDPTWHPSKKRRFSDNPMTSSSIARAYRDPRSHPRVRPIFPRSMAGRTSMENPSSNAKHAVERPNTSGMEAKLESTSKIEQFSATQLGNLRTALMDSGIDSWQAADVLSNFLTGRGYGVSPQRARDAIARLEGTNRALDCMQAELERVAVVM
jgi:hypothetical protein